MKQRLSSIALLVDDYDTAITYYTQTLGFELIEDTPISADKRWIVVRPRGSEGCNLLLAKASNEVQQAAIGNQAGGRVFLFLHTDDFYRDYETYTTKGVHFEEEPRKEVYGTVAVFKDIYGNRWDFIGPAT